MIFNSGNFGSFRRNRIEPGRPVLKLEMGPVDWLLEAIAIAGLMFFCGFVIYNFPKLPETLPTHFNGLGQADEFGDKSSFLLLPGVALFVYILLTLISLIPHRFNFSVKITPANAMRQYIMAIRMVRILKATLIWGFCYLSYATIQVANGAASGMGIWFVPVFIGVTLVPVLIYLIMAKKNR
jgi:uncharacterized membrane protein